jgi:hypothetical protein
MGHQIPVGERRIGGRKIKMRLGINNHLIELHLPIDKFYHLALHSLTLLQIQ